MWRAIGGVVAGVVTWAVVVTVLDVGLRYGWTDYAAVEKAMTFTVPMMIARLTESGLSSILSGWVAAGVARNRAAALWSGVVLLLTFLPIHYKLWNTFPLWYHLTFFASLIVLSLLGGMFARRPGAAQAA